MTGDGLLVLALRGARPLGVTGLANQMSTYRNTLSISGIASAFAGLLCACQSNVPTQPIAPADGAGAVAGMASDDGASTYLRYCAPCHGAQAEGDGPVADSIRVTMPNLRGLSRRNGGEFPAEVVASYIDGRRVPPVHGERYMPVWGVVFEATEVADPENRIAAVVEFLRELQYR